MEAVLGMTLDKKYTGKEPLFSIENLSKVYGEGRTAVHAIRDISVEIPAGKIILLLGPSGSGKSTFLNILGGLDRGSEGHVLFRNSNLTNFTDKELTLYRRHRIGFVFQFYNLMPSLTAYENIELVTEISKNPLNIEDALEIVGLEGRSDHFPSELSGGEQQRVAIARAIAKQPEILLCDEPTGALDSETGRSVLTAIKDVNEKLGSTVLMVTHAANTANMADLVIHFADGAIREIITNTNKTSPKEIVW